MDPVAAAVELQAMNVFMFIVTWALKIDCRPFGEDHAWHPNNTDSHRLLDITCAKQESKARTIEVVE